MSLAKEGTSPGSEFAIGGRLPSYEGTVQPEQVFEILGHAQLGLREPTGSEEHNNALAVLTELDEVAPLLGFNDWATALGLNVTSPMNSSPSKRERMITGGSGRILNDDWDAALA